MQVWGRSAAILRDGRGAAPPTQLLSLPRFYPRAQPVAVPLVRRGQQPIDLRNPLLLDPALEPLAKGRLLCRVGAAGLPQDRALEVGVGDEAVELLNSFLKKNGYALRTYLTLLAYADVIQKVLQPPK